MKYKVNSSAPREVVAIIGELENGYYTRSSSGTVYWHDHNGTANSAGVSWESLVRSPRTKVYKGDKLEITFD